MSLEAEILTEVRKLRDVVHDEALARTTLTGRVCLAEQMLDQNGKTLAQLQHGVNKDRDALSEWKRETFYPWKEQVVTHQDLKDTLDKRDADLKAWIRENALRIALACTVLGAGTGFGGSMVWKAIARAMGIE